MENAQKQLSDFDDRALEHRIERIAKVRIEAMFERHQAENKIVEAWSEFCGHNLVSQKSCVCSSNERVYRSLKSM